MMKSDHMPIFTLGVTYLAPPDSTPIDLLEDAYLLLSGLNSLIGTIATGLTESDGDMAANPRHIASILYGAQHTIQMIDGMVGAANIKLARQGKH